MWLLMEPEDVLLFRDSRPFNAGQDFRAEGGFPPLPSSIVGALRSTLISTALGKREKRYTFQDFIQRHPELIDLHTDFGDANSLGNLDFQGPLVCRYVAGSTDIDFLFPAPADLLGNLSPRLSTHKTPGIRKEIPGIVKSGHVAMALWSGSDVANGEDKLDAEPEGEWLTAEQMTSYLTGASSIRRECLDVSPETRVGIERTEARVTEQGKFYSLQVQRAHWSEAGAVGLAVHTTLPPGREFASGFVPLGGEGRSVHLRPLPEFQPELNSEAMRRKLAQVIADDEGRFRIVLATPAVFEAGVLPRVFAQHNLDGLVVNLMGIASGKPVPVGGWNLAVGAPRPLYRAVPAGTVYYGQLPQANLPNAERLVKLLHFSTLLQRSDAETDVAAYRAQMGFGLTLVGAWTQIEKYVSLPAGQAH